MVGRHRERRGPPVVRPCRRPHSHRPVQRPHRDREPWPLPELVDSSDPLHVTRLARNPRIARFCTDLRIDGQELGEGIRRMFDEMRLAGLVDPLYRQTSGTVRLTLSGEPVHGGLDGPGCLRKLVRSLRPSARLVPSALATSPGGRGLGSDRSAKAERVARGRPHRMGRQNSQGSSRRATAGSIAGQPTRSPGRATRRSRLLTSRGRSRVIVQHRPREMARLINRSRDSPAGEGPPTHRYSADTRRVVTAT